ncbi:hypothetical protein [Aquisalinus flavus]|uniref:Uncharacterized protein n=1 Tax=Aquisalinus flavus TaxID=1526572 RepID=A0A8J2V781_9PROT|nr:hypothetical protein [Aquisalinus flavus]MBD0425485.1 hypothetical protein [Aquisalinus flavus]UNE48882.1 hypothetical protein FF099_12885 [Aquisalinus flavus]GGD15695.1 hypothetical protein GCM10011342_25580 [Aquisalinus flavus]
MMKRYMRHPAFRAVLAIIVVFAAAFLVADLVNGTWQDNIGFYGGIGICLTLIFLIECLPPKKK